MTHYREKPFSDVFCTDETHDVRLFVSYQPHTAGIKRQSCRAEPADEAEVIESFGGCFPAAAHGRRRPTNRPDNRTDKKERNRARI